MKLISGSLLALILGLAASGCSSAEPIFYALAPTRDAHPVGAASAHLVKLRHPALAGYLDRAEIVSRVTDFRLRVASGESWSEPLSDMIGRVLVVDLGQRLPGALVFTESSPISADPDAVVSVDIQRFDVGSDGNVTLLAEIAVEKSPGHTLLGSKILELHARPAANDTPSLVAAMSSILGDLADQIAGYLKAS